MSENEEFDDLPHIEVDCLGGDTSNTSNVSESDSFVMPSAAELASQRERELFCERELRALPPVVRSDSSGSEGEALAAAVQALRVLPHPPPAPPTPAPPSHSALSVPVLLAALLPHLPPMPFLQDYLHSCSQLDDNTLAALTDDMLMHVSALVSSAENVWSSEEVVCVGAWVCVVSVGEQTARCRLAARRVLRVLVEERAAPSHAAALARAVCRAPPHALLPLADAAGDAAHSRLARDLCDTALALHLHMQKEEVSWSSCGEVCAAAARRWGALAGDERYSLLQLVGRRLAADSTRDTHNTQDTQHVASLLRELDRTRAPSQRYHPEHLKVSVGVSKLQLLFGAKN